MKPKFVVPTLTALALFTMTSLAQTPAPAAEPGAAATTPSAPPAPADGGAAAATPAPATPPAMPEATTNAAPVTPAAPPAAPPEAATNAAPAMPATPGEAATNAMPAAAATPAEAAPAAVAPVPEGTHPGAVMPLVVMDEVPLTDAIKNLARSAGLNYILDPKVNFGQIVEG